MQAAAETNTNEAFRSSLSTIDKKGRRVWVYPKKPKGSYHRARAVVAYTLLAILFGLPFIKINGEQALLFNIVERKFAIFGLLFHPQDFYIFALGFITLVVFIVLFTAVLGRLWCGWACPQTVFMEMVFRKIEYWIEGDAKEQRKLNAMPMNGNKFLKKSSKLLIFYAISFIIGNFLLAYIIGMDALRQIISEPVREHLGGFSAMIAFSLVFFGIFTRLREQACIICPYGRLQSVLIDKNSLVIAYDYKRGEPRGKAGKAEGDCVDCKACVVVCPAGIDIRNGIQLECINCAVCIDACDDIMGKLGRPKKLIKYASENQIAGGQKFRITPRIILYIAVLAVLISLVSIFSIGRSDVEATLLRARGSLYQKEANGAISNLFTVSLINNTKSFLPIELRIEHIPEAKIILIGKEKLILAPEKVNETMIIVELPQNKLPKMKNEIEVQILSRGKLLNEVETKFMAPAR